ncbi:MAG: hypothetical protein GXO87_03535 [Chlorobi bacterium]|nr:hypothetical protein [Chlorobiota bacterium]
MANIELYKLDKQLKTFLAAFLFALGAGVSTGIIYLQFTTDLTPAGTIERYNGSPTNADEFEIAESYPKPISEMLITTHSHIISFALIFGALGFIFYFNSVITDFWKTFLIIEPLVSTLVTFLSIWGIRYVHEGFIFLTIASAMLMYISFYVMIIVLFYELLFKKDISNRSNR